MAAQPVNVGSRRQLFLDDFWFAKQDNVKLTLHTPELKEVALPNDRPWEERGIHCTGVLLDGSRYRMWYRASEGSLTAPDLARSWQCYAESSDGIHWEKPNLGLVEWDGSKQNNIVFPSATLGRNASVILDPNAPADERYKMITRADAHPVTILGYVSADGLRWRPAEGNPFLTEGPFDSPNTLLWDDERQRYVIYLRGVDMSVPGPFKGGRRAVRRSESPDFRHWTPAELVLGPDEQDPANLHFYTNAATKYDRAERAYFIFPKAFYPDRHYPGAPVPGLSDIRFTFSRDGIHWDRRFRQPYITAGLDERNWVDRNPGFGAGIVPTGPTEISMYYWELNHSPECRVRRCTLRTDGFVSVEGPYTGWGEFTTHPIVFSGKRLEFNYSTSGGGSLFVELQAADGSPLPGYALADCAEIYGDKIDGVVRWQGGDDVSALAGQPVRLRVRLRDAHLFAFHFQD